MPRPSYIHTYSDASLRQVVSELVEILQESQVCDEGTSIRSLQDFLAPNLGRIGRKRLYIMEQIRHMAHALPGVGSNPPMDLFDRIDLVSLESITSREFTLVTSCEGITIHATPDTGQIHWMSQWGAIDLLRQHEHIARKSFGHASELYLNSRFILERFIELR